MLAKKSSMNALPFASPDEHPDLIAVTKQCRDVEAKLTHARAALSAVEARSAEAVAIGKEGGDDLEDRAREVRVLERALDLARQRAPEVRQAVIDEFVTPLREDMQRALLDFEEASAAVAAHYARMADIEARAVQLLGAGAAEGHVGRLMLPPHQEPAALRIIMEGNAKRAGLRWTR